MAEKSKTNHFERCIPVVLSIAGSDCSGGAGIQADLKTCSALGVYCMTAVTAVTVQNPDSLRSVNPTGAKLLTEQLEAAVDACRPDAVKIGLLPDVSSILAVSEFIDRHNLVNIVIDPVLSATAGGNLSIDPDKAVRLLCDTIFRQARLITPNLPELAKIASVSRLDTSIPAVEIAAELSASFRHGSYLIKGGHADSETCTDLLCEIGSEPIAFRSERIASSHTHGTGCTLSSAIACGLAKKMPLAEAVRQAKRFIADSITRGRDWPVFQQYGPVCQFRVETEI